MRFTRRHLFKSLAGAAIAGVVGGCAASKSEDRFPASRAILAPVSQLDNGVDLATTTTTSTTSDDTVYWYVEPRWESTGNVRWGTLQVRGTRVSIQRVPIGRGYFPTLGGFEI